MALEVMKKVMKLLVFIALSLGASPAVAAPVYLECHLAGGTKPGEDVFRWDIALNEEAGTVSYTIANGAKVRNHPALFTATEVSWNTLVENSIIRGGGLTIDRLDLTFTRKPLQIGNNPPSGGALGRCKVVNTPSRAF